MAPECLPLSNQGLAWHAVGQLTMIMGTLPSGASTPVIACSACWAPMRNAARDGIARGSVDGVKMDYGSAIMHTV